MNDAKRRSVASAGLLFAGAALGALLAASGMVESISVPADERNLAEVNGWVVSQADFQRAVETLRPGRQSSLTVDQQRELLDRLIEEKLMLQRGLEMGLVETEPAVRKAITTAMIQTISAELAVMEPSKEDLEAFFAENLSYFAKPARLRVKQLLFASKNKPDALARAKTVSAELRGGLISFTEAQELADPVILVVPDSLLPLHKLRDYIGPGLTDLAAGMPSGSVSEPRLSQAGYAVLFVIENQPGAPQALDDVRARVIVEYQRRAVDQSLREYLAMLRAEADVSIAADVFQAANSARTIDSSPVKR